MVFCFYLDNFTMKIYDIVNITGTKEVCSFGLGNNDDLEDILVSY
jgi:hypothetical protein